MLPSGLRLRFEVGADGAVRAIYPTRPRPVAGTFGLCILFRWRYRATRKGARPWSGNALFRDQLPSSSWWLFLVGLVFQRRRRLPFMFSSVEMPRPIQTRLML